MHKSQTFGQKLKDLAQLLRIIMSVSLGDYGGLVLGLSVLIAWLSLYFLDDPSHKFVVFFSMTSLGVLLMLGMLRKEKTYDPEQTRPALAHLAEKIPEARWLTLLTDDGLIVGSFPGPPIVKPDATAAMGATMFSLGERVSNDLGGGDQRYTIVAGSNALHLFVVLSKKYVLALGLHPDVSVDAVLNTLRGSAAPIFDVLEIEQPPSWLIT